MRDYGTFTLGGLSSEDFNIIITEPPKMIFAEQEIESISVAGRSGNLVIDCERYKNVTVPYKCAFIPKAPQGLRELATSALSLLKSTAKYQRLENSFHNDCYRMARVTGKLTVESLMEKCGKFTVDFDCKPQRFLADGETVFEFASAGTIINPTDFAALPLITVYGTEPGEVSVAGVTVKIKEIQDQITLDCELQNAYRQVADSSPENYNSKISALDFPKLQPGNNGVSFTGGITKVEIIPRWWTL